MLGGGRQDGVRRSRTIARPRATLAPPIPVIAMGSTGCARTKRAQAHLARRTQSRGQDTGVTLVLRHGALQVEFCLALCCGVGRTVFVVLAASQSSPPGRLAPPPCSVVVCARGKRWRAPGSRLKGCRCSCRGAPRALCVRATPWRHASHFRCRVAEPVPRGRLLPRLNALGCGSLCEALGRGVSRLVCSARVPPPPCGVGLVA